MAALLVGISVGVKLVCLEKPLYIMALQKRYNITVYVSPTGIKLREIGTAGEDEMVIGGFFRATSVMLALSCLLLTGRAAEAQAPFATDSALTPAIVEGVIASYPALEAKARELNQDGSLPDSSEVSGWTAFMAASGAKAQLDGTVANYGFANFETWLQALSTVARAYGFAKDGGAMDADMAEAIARIDSDPNIPEAQKEMLRQQMQAAAAAIAGMRPSQENIDAVTPYIGELTALFDKN